jgi:hypothetical protein
MWDIYSTQKTWKCIKLCRGSTITYVVLFRNKWRIADATIWVCKNGLLTECRLKHGGSKNAYEKFRGWVYLKKLVIFEQNCTKTILFFILRYTWDVTQFKSSFWITQHVDYEYLWNYDVSSSDLKIVEPQNILDNLIYERFRQPPYIDGTKNQFLVQFFHGLTSDSLTRSHFEYDGFHIAFLFFEYV